MFFFLRKSQTHGRKKFLNYVWRIWCRRNLCFRT